MRESNLRCLKKQRTVPRASPAGLKWARAGIKDSKSWGTLRLWVQIKKRQPQLAYFATYRRPLVILLIHAAEILLSVSTSSRKVNTLTPRRDQESGGIAIRTFPMEFLGIRLPPCRSSSTVSATKWAMKKVALAAGLNFQVPSRQTGRIMNVCAP